MINTLLDVLAFVFCGIVGLYLVGALARWVMQQMTMDQDTYDDLQKLRNMVKDLRGAIRDMAAQLEAVNRKVDDQERQIADLQMVAHEHDFKAA